MHDWQSIIAITLVALSAAYLALRGWQVLMRKRTPGCASGCGACPANGEKQKVGSGENTPDKQRTLVTIELTKRDRLV